MKFVMILFFQRLTAAAASGADGQSPEYLLRINQRRAKAKKNKNLKDEKGSGFKSSISFQHSISFRCFDLEAPLSFYLFFFSA